MADIFSFGTRNDILARESSFLQSVTVRLVLAAVMSLSPTSDSSCSLTYIEKCRRAKNYHV